jgi:hypothetical protein
MRCCQGISAALLPASLRNFNFLSSDLLADNGSPPEAEFHLRPHYRSPTPLDATLVKAKAGLDEFITEKYADDIAGIGALDFYELRGSWQRSNEFSPPVFLGLPCGLSSQNHCGPGHPFRRTITHSRRTAAPSTLGLLSKTCDRIWRRSPEF